MGKERERNEKGKVVQVERMYSRMNEWKREKNTGDFDDYRLAKDLIKLFTPHKAQHSSYPTNSLSYTDRNTG